MRWGGEKRSLSWPQMCTGVFQGGYSFQPVRVAVPWQSYLYVTEEGCCIHSGSLICCETVKTQDMQLCGGGVCVFKCLISNICRRAESMSHFCALGFKKVITVLRGLDESLDLGISSESAPNEPQVFSSQLILSMYLFLVTAYKLGCVGYFSSSKAIPGLIWPSYTQIPGPGAVPGKARVVAGRTCGWKFQLRYLGVPLSVSVVLLLKWG